MEYTPVLICEKCREVRNANRQINCKSKKIRRGICDAAQMIRYVKKNERKKTLNRKH